jgi:serine protease Do
MTLRNKVTFLVSLLLTCGIIVYAQQAAPELALAPQDDSDQIGSFAFFQGGNSFLGVYAEDIDKEKATRYGLREARGVGVTKVVAGSPAEKAGLRKDDVILRFDNESVTSVRKLNRLVSEVAPDQTVRLAVSRAGTEQEIAVTLAKREHSFSTIQGLMKGPRAGVWTWPEGSDDSFVFALGKNRRIGVSTMQLTKQLADYFGVADGKGVLVTSVGADSPAAKAGIKAGDVITAVDGEKVEGAGDLSRALNKKKEGDVTLTLIRDRNQRTITVTPKESTPSGHTGSVVIPDIEIPMPDVNIRLPRIVIPDINVNLPKKIRVARTSSTQPI